MVKSFMFCFCLIVTSTNVDSVPIHRDGSFSIEDFEGDNKILKKNMTYVEMDDMMVPSDRSGQMNEAYRWKKGKIPFSFAPGYTKRNMMDIYTAMRYIEDFTCIRFRNRQKSDDDYLHIKNVKGKCSSYVGNVRKGAQLVSLDPNSGQCGKPTFTGHVLHELVHAIGFFHEHARDDRDSYITILYENLPKDERTRKNYNKNKDNYLQSNSYGVPYNFGSIMHYSKRGGSINGRDTIVRKRIKAGTQPPLDGVMGQREKLSRGDVVMIQRMYYKECGGTDERNIPWEIPDLEDWMEDRKLNTDEEFQVEEITDESDDIIDEILQDQIILLTTTRKPITTRPTNKLIMTTKPTVTWPSNLFNVLQVAFQNMVQSG